MLKKSTHDEEFERPNNELGKNLSNLKELGYLNEQTNGSVTINIDNRQFFINEISGSYNLVGNSNKTGEMTLTTNNNQRVISGNFTGAQFGDNVNLQGDHVQQTKSETHGIAEKEFEALFQFINSLPDSSEKNDALNDAKQVQEEVKKGNLERAKKFYSILTDIVRTSAAGLTLGTHFGWF